MTSWLDIVSRVESLEGLSLRLDLVADCERRPVAGPPPIHFYTPTFKHYCTPELTCGGGNAWPAVSITGADCALKCDHCKARILEPMTPARTPEALWRAVNEFVAGGARGMLLTGGSNQRNEVEYDAFFSTLRRIKDRFPSFRIAVHTALVDRPTAQRMEEAGIDVAMMDVIGAQETVTQVYHLKRPVADFERTLEHLVETRMRVVPHIVLGLHYGRFLGERQALEAVARHRPDALVLVVVMPTYATPRRPFAVPDVHESGRFFLEARAALAGIPLLLGCARPAGSAKAVIDTYAVMAGLDGIAHPFEGVVELAARLGRGVRATAACCAMAAGEEARVAGGDTGVALSLDDILHDEARRRLGGIRVVNGGGCCR
jgi:lipoyl synthase